MSYRESHEMHKAVCADCGQECGVPFKPILTGQFTVEIVGQREDDREDLDISFSSLVRSVAKHFASCARFKPRVDRVIPTSFNIRALFIRNRISRDWSNQI